MIATPKQPLPAPVQIEDPNMTALHNYLVAAANKPNVLTVAQFKKFEPLFRAGVFVKNVDDVRVQRLTEEYSKHVDFYKETTIVVSAHDPTVVLTLPAVFTPVKSFDANDKNSILVATNQAMAHNSVPKYQEDAFYAMFMAFQGEQLKNKKVISQYSEQFAVRAKEFFDKYSDAKAAEAAPVANVTEELPPVNNSNTTWD